MVNNRISFGSQVYNAVIIENLGPIIVKYTDELSNFKRVFYDSSEFNDTRSKKTPDIWAINTKITLVDNKTMIVTADRVRVKYDEPCQF